MTWSRWEGAVAAAALLAWAHLQGMPALQKTCAQVVSTKGLLEKIVFLFFFFFFNFLPLSWLNAGFLSW